MLNRITVNIHSSIRIEADKVLYIDPFRLEKETHDADVIFVTHSHFDHFSPEDLAKAAKEDTLYVMPVSMKQDALDAGFAEEQLVLCVPGTALEVMGIPVETVPSYNTDKPMHPKANGWLGYVITAGGKRIYIGGDMDATSEAEQVKCDIAMLPIGGTYTMNVRQAADLVNRMNPAAVIPTHYGSLTGTAEDGKAFEALVNDEIQVIHKL